MGAFGGTLVVILISLLAGAIAYVGDRVGHVVGRKRLSLFGLRPRHTSTIFAVGTGMLIALIVTLVAISVSSYVQTAFFRLGEVNDRIIALQAEAAALDRHTHEENVVVNRGDLMYGAVLLLQPAEPAQARYRKLATFFDDTIKNVNAAYGQGVLGARALRANTAHSSEASTSAKLREVLTDIEPTLLKNSQVLILAVADRNLFPHDEIHFRLQGLPDRRIFAADELVASMPIGGNGMNSQVAINQLAQAASQQAVSHGLPFYFATPLSETPPREIRAIDAQMARGGRYVLEAHAATDIFPHLGGLPLIFKLVPAGA